MEFTKLNQKNGTQLFANKKQAELYRSRPSYSDELIEILLKFVNIPKNEKINLLVDTACGSGQLTRPIAKFCNKIIAIDASESQIEEAKKIEHESMKNVEFRVGNSEQIPVEDQTVDVITVAEAIHYFADIKSFYREVDRCLKPNGVLAIFAYNFCEFYGFDSALNDKINSCWLKYFRGDNYLEPCWHKGIFTLFNEYKDLPLYRRTHSRFYDFLELQYPLKQYLDIFRSLSAYIVYNERHCDKPDMVELLKNDWLDILGNPLTGVNTILSSRWPVYLFMFRKDSI